MVEEKSNLDNNLAWYKDISYFNGLPEKDLISISKITVFRNYLPKYHIIIEGGSCQSAYLILKGSVNVFRTSLNGRKQVVSRLDPGDWINASCCLNFNEKNLASAVALSPVKVLSFANEKFRELVKKNSLFGLMVLDNFSSRIEKMTDQIENLSLRSTSGRVAHFLLGHADESGVIHWHCTQKDIADRIGTVADVVGRVARKFVDDGLIEMPDRHYIIIKDEEGLIKEALN